MNYDEKLDHILQKYDMYNDFRHEHDKVYQSFNDAYAHINHYIEEEARAFTRKFHRPPKVIIWGGGFFCEYVLLPFTAVQNLDIVAIVDKKVDEGAELFCGGHKVESLKRLKNDDYDIIIISSSAARREMLGVIQNDLHKHYIDIFGFDQKIQYVTITDLAIKPGISWEYINLSIVSIICAYQKAKNAKHLKTVIEAFFYIRSFPLAFAYLDIYVQSGYEGAEKLLLLKEEIKALFQEIKSALNKQKNKNVLLFLADGLTYEASLYYMPFIRDEKHFFYENVRSAAIYTGESLRTIFLGKYLFQDDIYKVSNLEAQDTTFKDFIDADYDFLTYDWRYLLNNDTYQKRVVDRVFKVGFQSNYASCNLWDYICYLAENTKDNITFMRLEETHNPANRILAYAQDDFSLARLYDGKYECPLVDEEKVDPFAKVQAYAAKLLDVELHFYLDFLKSDDSVVFFADHGISSLIEESNAISRVHMPIVLLDKSIKRGKTQNLMTLKDFSKIVKTLVFQHKVYLSKEEYVFSERMPIYGESLQKKYKELGIEENTTSLRIISTTKDRYIVWGDGRKEYYVGRTSKNMLADILNEREKYFQKINREHPVPEEFLSPK